MSCLFIPFLGLSTLLFGQMALLLCSKETTIEFSLKLLSCHSELSFLKRMGMYLLYENRQFPG